MLDELRNFTITCNFNDSHLHCEVNEGFASVIPQSSYCRINEETRQEKCETESLCYCKMYQH